MSYRKKFMDAKTSPWSLLVGMMEASMPKVLRCVRQRIDSRVVDGCIVSI